MCLYPRLMENKKYRANKKNGGVIPAVNDNRTRWVTIGCEECIECRKQKARQWQVRLLEDIKTNTNGKMIAFTFSNEAIRKLNTQWIKRYNKNTEQTEITNISTLRGYDKDNAIATKGIRLFLERYRKKYKKSLRHWLITELGHKGTENIHMHGIIWTDKPLTEIEEIWNYGFIWKGYKRLGTYQNYVNNRTVNYTTKYVTKIDLQHKTYKPIILTSPGIGNKYNGKYNKYNGTETNETYRTNTGHTITLPTYWRNKIYTEKEKEQLWIQKLDKQETWICGEKIDISKNQIKYNALLEYHRTRNKDLGYGSNKKDEKRAKYELERRKILHSARIKTPSARS